MHEVFGGPLIERGEESKRAEPVVAVPLDALGLRASQHLADMPHAEPFTDSGNAGKDLLGGNRRIGKALRLIEADIAGTAGLGAVGLSKIFGECGMAAAGGLRVAPHGVEVADLASDQFLRLGLFQVRLLGALSHERLPAEDIG